MSRLELIFYILAIVCMAVFVLLLITAILYIKNYFSSYGMSFSQGWKDAIQYVISNSGSWAVYSVILFGIARITRRLEHIKPLPVPTPSAGLSRDAVSSAANNSTPAHPEKMQKDQNDTHPASEQEPETPDNESSESDLEREKVK